MIVIGILFDSYNNNNNSHGLSLFVLHQSRMATHYCIGWQGDDCAKRGMWWPVNTGSLVR